MLCFRLEDYIFPRNSDTISFFMLHAFCNIWLLINSYVVSNNYAYRVLHPDDPVLLLKTIVLPFCVHADILFQEQNHEF